MAQPMLLQTAEHHSTNLCMVAAKTQHITYRLGNERLESSAVERDLGLLVDGKLNMSQQCPGSQEGQQFLGGIRHSIASQARGGIVPLCSALGRPHLQCWGSLGCHNVRKTLSYWRVSKGEGP